MQIVGNSHVGCVREENQDVYRLEKIDGGVMLALICDGMGGVAGGGVAAALACDEFCRTFAEQYEKIAAGKALTAFDARRIFSHAVYSANKSVFDRSVTDFFLSGMGTTLCAVCFSRGDIFVASVGDSRAYLYRQGHIRRLTRDDTFVQDLIDKGELTEEKAKTHENRSLLTRCIGTSAYTEFYFDSLPLCPGDTVLMCSDGLTGYYSDSALASELSSGASPKDMVAHFIGGACAMGGQDNVTCIVARAQDAEK